MDKPTPVDLTPAQAKLWDETRTALLWHCLAFTHIFYTLLDTVHSKYIALFTRDVPIAATDGSCLMFNPDTYFKLNLNERIFVASHEIMHCILNHLVMAFQWRKRGEVAYVDGKKLPYIHMLMNHAQDYVINAILVESKVGTMPKMGLLDTKIGGPQDNAVDVYRKIMKDAKVIGFKLPGAGGTGNDDGGDGGVQAPNGQQPFDTHLDPGTGKGKDPAQASQERSQTEWDTQIAAAAQAARLQGKLPAGLERLLGEILDPKVDWREKIQGLFARRGGSDTYNWRKVDRRLIVRDIVAPGRSGYGCGTVVVGVDTSGSIGSTELDMFMAEMAGILEDCRPERLLIVWCDAKVHRVDEADDPGDLRVIRCKGAPGGGGTSFIPVFEWMADEGIEPDALVYLTDGYGSFPQQAPAFPVIWGSITKAQYPFGDVVEIDKAA